MILGKFHEVHFWMRGTGPRSILQREGLASLNNVQENNLYLFLIFSFRSKFFKIFFYEINIFIKFGNLLRVIISHEYISFLTLPDQIQVNS